MSKINLMNELDGKLMFSVCTLLFIGLIMVGSASISIADGKLGQPLFYFNRQLIFTVIGIVLATISMRIRLSVWRQMAPLLLIIGVGLLILVLIPGVGREVNGSRRWLPLGPISIQVAEVIKLFSVIYVADYLQRHHSLLQGSFFKVIGPLILLGVAAILLLLQPDMGSVVVIFATVLAMLFLGGSRLDVFATLISIFAALFMALIWFAPYRLQRLKNIHGPMGRSIW